LSLSLVLSGKSALAAESLDQIIEGAKQTQLSDSFIQEVKMELVSKNGSVRERRFEMRVKYDGDIVKTYARFSFPKDVAGTQLVVVDNPNQTDDQLLYLPALHRVNRIAGKAKSGSFMGSDFSFEDMELNGEFEGNHVLASETDIEWLIETTPNSGSAYGLIKLHIRKSDHFPEAIEFFDKKMKPVKILSVEDTKVVGDGIIPTRSVMKNLKKGTKTIMEVTNHRDGDGEVLDECFTRAFMERHG